MPGTVLSSGWSPPAQRWGRGSGFPRKGLPGAWRWDLGSAKTELRAELKFYREVLGLGSKPRQMLGLGLDRLARGKGWCGAGGAGADLGNTMDISPAPWRPPSGWWCPLAACVRRRA